MVFPVTCVEPAIRVNCVAGGLRFVEISLHDVWTTGPHLPSLVRSKDLGSTDFHNLELKESRDIGPVRCEEKFALFLARGAKELCLKFRN